ncbi:MAG: hypothetical protein ABIP78_05570 [Pyrinomonadaceae bacterium]
MKNIKYYFKTNFFILAALVSLLAVPLESCASGSAPLEPAPVEDVKVDELIQTSPTPKPKIKKKVKITPNKMDTKLTAVSTGIWGARGIILNVEENGVSIQYECADGQIEQKLMMNQQGDFAVNGFHTPQRGGPIRVDVKEARQSARFEGKVSGDKMTLKVTLTETNEVIGEFTLERGKTPRMTRCY